MNTPDFNKLRQEYTKLGILESDILENPFDFFKKWIEEAITLGVKEANAVQLSTVDKNCMPSSRMVLLKELTEKGFVFYTNYKSRKATHISSNPHVALTFFWKELERQVRIEGIAEKVSKEESDAYFNSRPYESKISAVISQQSQVIPNREYIIEKWEKYKASYTDKEINRLDNWGGYIVIPSHFEFWQGRANRLHDRFRFLLIKKEWKIERLAP
ncbi:pyridoxamine 5'-phosphate oxidase [bacterium]|nr:pyridoxamine 5'-phosphate oxidase [bacterium]